MKHNDKPVIGILGGMGPAATGEFLLELTKATPAERDQDHFQTVTISDTSVPDRTTCILAGDDSPLAVIRRDLWTLVSWGVDLLAVPCNTAHYFIDQFVDDLPIPLVHIVEATLDAASGLSPEGAWLTATTGTVRTELYQKAAARRGYRVYVPNAAQQEEVMATVGEVKSGDMAAAGARYRTLADELYAEVPVPALTACTELPLAFDASGLPARRAVSSLTALAHATVKRAFDLA